MHSTNVTIEKIWTFVLKSLVGWNLAGLRLLTLGRREGGIEIRMSSWLQVPECEFAFCLESREVDQDIRSYVDMKLTTTKTLHKWNSYERLREEIVGRLQSANGTWVHSRHITTRQICPEIGIHVRFNLGEAYHLQISIGGMPAGSP